MLIPHHNPYRAKLTTHFRCFIYACHWKKAIGYPILARAFDVNDETIGKICRARPNSRDYKDVHSIAAQMGIDEMYAKFATPELEDRVQKILDGRCIEDRFGGRGAEQFTTEGIYWVPDGRGETVAIDIRHYDTIKKELGDKWESPYENPQGFYTHHPKLGWGSHLPRPWISGQEVLRYFAAKPIHAESYRNES
jgi:hypothetical protein